MVVNNSDCCGVVLAEDVADMVPEGSTLLAMLVVAAVVVVLP